MTAYDGAGYLVRAADRAHMQEESFRHPFNRNSELHGIDLARAVGLTRTAVMLARVPPGRESYAQHTHLSEEEWMFVVSGNAIVEIGDVTFTVGPGDFVGFPAGGLPHHVRNPSGEDVVYVCGGERTHVDVIDYPACARVVVRVGTRLTVYPAHAGEPMAA